MSLLPETADTGSIVNTDLTGASDDAPAGPIFAEIPDAAPAPASAPDIKAEHRERLTHVKALAQQVKLAAQEKERLQWERQQGRQEREMLIAEVQRARGSPWEYAKAHGWDAQKVAEAELYPQGEEGRAEKAERIALEVKQQFDGVLNHLRTSQETQARVEAWEQAKASAIKTFEAGATDKFQNLSAFIDKQAALTGTSKADALVSELLLAVDQIKRNPKTAPHATEYSDQEICEMLEQRYAGFAPAPKKQHSSKTLAPGSVADDAATRGTVFGSQAYYKQQAREIVDAYRAAKGIKDPEPRLYSPQELADLESKIYGADARFNKEADRKHSAALVETERAKAKLRGTR